MDHPDQLSPQDDLLKPTLAKNDDVTGFANPWNPDSLVMAAFFAGPFAGGFLIAQNFKRLGIPDRFGPALGLFVGIGFLATMTLTSLIRFECIDLADPTTRLICRWGTRGATIVLALIVTRWQKQRFRLYMHDGHQPTSLWVPGIIAVLLGVVLSRVVVFICVLLLGLVTLK